MAFDGIITCAMVHELQDTILLGKIEKVYQPENDELVFHIHTKKGNVKLYASVNSARSCLHFIETNPANPPAPLAFCMLLRKHLQGGRIVDIRQKDGERIIEISLETLNELGFTVSKKLIFEIMGKHSNIVLVDMTTGKIIDSIKRVSIDVNRARQILPGKLYQYPPSQDKISFKEITEEVLNAMDPNPKEILSKVGGISPAVSAQLAGQENRFQWLSGVLSSIEDGTTRPRVYLDQKGIPQEFHIAPLSQYEGADRLDFDTLSQCIAYYFDNKASSNRARQKSHDLVKTVSGLLDKLYLKKQRLSEDLLKAENSEDLRLYGELLTANMHLVKPGDKWVEVINYYDGSQVKIPLDERFTPAKNAQQYFKRYGKSKTAVKEKQAQLLENDGDIQYLESVLTYLNNTDSIEEIEALRTELTETGYVRRRKTSGYKEKKYKVQPHVYTLSDGSQVLVGRNNRENDVLTLKTADKHDLWLHTKDIPGSHVIVKTGGRELSEKALFEAAAIAAYHSKGRTSENVPVDYVPVKYVKKPSGAKPGMVIFTNNRTLWVNPALPEGNISAGAFPHQQK